MTNSINKRTLIIPVLILSLFCFILVLPQSVFSAGSSSSSISKPLSAKEKREKANKYFTIAKQDQDKGEYARAIKNYKKAVKIDNKYAEAYSNLGYCYRKSGDYDWALSSYKKALKIDPKLAPAHEYIGEAYAELGKFDKAEEHLAILKTIDQENAEKLEAYIEKMRSSS